MLITPSILSIPPYISTSWKSIASLHVEMQLSHPVLVVTLTTGARINIPHLDNISIEAIFANHAKHLELEQGSAPEKLPPKKPAAPSPAKDTLASSFSFPLETPFNAPLNNLDHMGAVLQHNPEQSDAPDLPKELIQKITGLSKTIGISDPNMIPQPEPHCNCTHCQIARALHAGFEAHEPEQIANEEEEIVSEEDLKFRTWDINQTGDKLFIVQNPLDAKEHYSVYLGEPIGCTCGEKHCEHVRAVLNS
ncbi:MAG: hypothetical protein JSR39_09350 [Verrucomicrobia bacterium]|nr:hypothetical protein [Verrucomicrobiota bacterium]